MVIDKNTDIKLSGVIPDLASRWVDVRKDLFNLTNHQIRITEGLRTFSQQWNAWGEGRLKDKDGTWIICDMSKVVTFAKAGESYHQYGLAIDSCFLGSDPYLVGDPKGQTIWIQYGYLCKKNGLTWGGDFKHPDKPHCEINYGLNIHSIQIIYEDSGIKGVWKKCKQVSSCGMELV